MKISFSRALPLLTGNSTSQSRSLVSDTSQKIGNMAKMLYRGIAGKEVTVLLGRARRFLVKHVCIREDVIYSELLALVAILRIYKVSTHKFSPAEQGAIGRSAMLGIIQVVLIKKYITSKCDLIFPPIIAVPLMLLAFSAIMKGFHMEVNLGKDLSNSEQGVCQCLDILHDHASDERELRELRNELEFPGPAGAKRRRLEDRAVLI